jgi:hypothetical protein
MHASRGQTFCEHVTDDCEPRVTFRTHNDDGFFAAKLRVIADAPVSSERVHQLAEEQRSFHTAAQILALEMTTSDSPGFILPDPRITALEAPYTFFLPSEAELTAVSVGDTVKLLFEYLSPGEKWGGERMWVTVEECNGSHLRGTLDNLPDEPTSPLHLRDMISFERYHILDIEWSKPVKAPAPLQRRQYWERCLVDDCVLYGGVPVEYIYREEPDMETEGDKYPDSGWRIRGQMGDATDAEIDARKFSYVALGAVLNRDDSWLHLIDAPIGSRYMRDFELDDYLEQSDSSPETRPQLS